MLKTREASDASYMHCADKCTALWTRHWTKSHCRQSKRTPKRKQTRRLQGRRRSKKMQPSCLLSWRGVKLPDVGCTHCSFWSGFKTAGVRACIEQQEPEKRKKRRVTGQSRSKKQIWCWFQTLANYLIQCWFQTLTNYFNNTSQKNLIYIPGPEASRWQSI